jgi:predicted acylesterase/phospholipase RssA
MGFRDRLNERRENRRERLEKLKDRIGKIKSDAVNKIKDVHENVNDLAEKIGDEIEESAFGRLIDAGEVAMDRLTVRTYPTSKRSFRFPEASDRRLKRKLNFGVAFSGGGTRSMSLSLGQMRALRSMDLDDKIRYIGCISGGAWFAVPYTYLPRGGFASAISDNDWLGRHVDPARLTWRTASRTGGPHGILARQITRSEIYLLALSHIVDVLTSRGSNISVPILDIELTLNDYDEIYGRIIEDIFLADIGLAGERYVGWKMHEDVDTIIERHKDQIKITNPNLDRKDFVWVDRDRPFLLVNGSVNQDAIFDPDEPVRYEVMKLTKELRFDHYEFTPLYHGVHAQSTGRLGLRVGGGYAENIGFDTWIPVRKNDETVTVTPGIDSHRLSLKDMMGTSGAAPAFITHAAEGLFPPMNVFPKYRMWPVESGAKPATVERPFGDGGYVDNYGVIPLLKRGVSKIIVCINTNASIGKDTAWTNDIRLDSFLPILFGIPVPKRGVSEIMSPSIFLGKKGQVFESVGYASTVQGLLCAKDLANAPAVGRTEGPTGRIDADDLARLDLSGAVGDTDPDAYRGMVRGPIYYLGTYRTVSNDFFGVPGGDTVHILWVYNEASRAWSEQLPSEVQRKLGTGVLDGFPHVGTFQGGKDPNLDGFRERIEREMDKEGPVKGFFKGVSASTRASAANNEFIDLHPEQVNLMANLSAWSLLQLRPIIEGELLAKELRQRARSSVSLCQTLRSSGATNSLRRAFATSHRQGGGFPSSSARRLRELSKRFLN